MSKTPDYTKKAIANYQKTKERIGILFDKGTKERIYNIYGNGYSINNYVKTLVDNDLNEKENAKHDTPPAINENDPNFPFKRQ